MRSGEGILSLAVFGDTGDTNIKKEMEVSLQAGEIVGVLYDALLKQYKDPETEDTLKKPKRPVCPSGILPVCGGRRYLWQQKYVPRLSPGHSRQWYPQGVGGTVPHFGPEAGAAGQVPRGR